MFDIPTVKRIAEQFETEMELSLNEQHEESSLLMENTYIPELPDGTGKLYILMSNAFKVLSIVVFIFRRHKISTFRAWQIFGS